MPPTVKGANGRVEGRGALEMRGGRGGRCLRRAAAPAPLAQEVLLDTVVAQHVEQPRLETEGTASFRERTKAGGSRAHWRRRRLVRCLPRLGVELTEALRLRCENALQKERLKILVVPAPRHVPQAGACEGAARVSPLLRSPASLPRKACDLCRPATVRTAKRRVHRL